MVHAWSIPTRGTLKIQRKDRALLCKCSMVWILEIFGAADTARRSSFHKFFSCHCNAAAEGEVEIGLTFAHRPGLWSLDLTK